MASVRLQSPIGCRKLIRGVKNQKNSGTTPYTLAVAAVGRFKCLISQAIVLDF